MKRERATPKLKRKQKAGKAEQIEGAVISDREKLIKRTHELEVEKEKRAASKEVLEAFTASTYS